MLSLKIGSVKCDLTVVLNLQEKVLESSGTIKKDCEDVEMSVLLMYNSHEYVLESKRLMIHFAGR